MKMWPSFVIILPIIIHSVLTQDVIDVVNPCVCNATGSIGNTCYGQQCDCKLNVAGLNCDSCIKDTFGFGKNGCTRCECDPIGSKRTNCDLINGNCECNDGYTGRQCNQCAKNYWGDPNLECQRCDCDPLGSISTECDTDTGKCTCKYGVTGNKCDSCGYGYFGQPSSCEDCDSCFDSCSSNIDIIEDNTNDLINRANNLNATHDNGNNEIKWQEIDLTIDEIDNILNTFHQDVTDFYKHVNESFARYNGTLNELNNFNASIVDVGGQIDRINEKIVKVRMLADDFKVNSTNLQNENVDGALTLAKKASDKIDALDTDVQDIETNFEEMEEKCKDAIHYMDENNFDELSERIRVIFQNFTTDVLEFEKVVSTINKLLCGEHTDTCDFNCGGVGCNKCGGPSCDKNTVTIAELSSKKANESGTNINEKMENINRLIHEMSLGIRNVSDLSTNITNTNNEIQAMVNSTSQDINYGNDNIRELEKLKNDFESESIEIEQIKAMAKQILALKLPEYKENLDSMNEIFKLIEKLKNESIQAKIDAELILETIDNIKIVKEDIVMNLQNATQALEDTQYDVETISEYLKFVDKMIENALDLKNVKEKLYEVDERSKNITSNFLQLRAERIKAILDRADKIKNNAALLSSELSVDIDISKNLNEADIYFDNLNGIMDCCLEIYTSISYFQQICSPEQNFNINWNCGSFTCKLVT